MGCSGVPTAVFTETNLGTCLAVPASPDITADDFKIGCTISRSRFTHIYICESLNGRGGKGASQLFPRIRNYQGQSSDGDAKITTLSLIGVFASQVCFSGFKCYLVSSNTRYFIKCSYSCRVTETQWSRSLQSEFCC
ncbi:uncharacterized protein LOC130986164 isoform X5 [Salvia miltiorrhiza]|uniref:uncharacterized protein LOC130986164 isoform X5 n=1 Tax=Salvia miltiorrhiza TaxID=226208 RepID=UPI0025AB663B|nr:uncharacterized protein LOC130986164 isoform X5 [Salvia miltiorrhiza]